MCFKWNMPLLWWDMWITIHNRLTTASLLNLASVCILWNKHSYINWSPGGICSLNGIASMLWWGMWITKHITGWQQPPFWIWSVSISYEINIAILIGLLMPDRVQLCWKKAMTFGLQLISVCCMELSNTNKRLIFICLLFIC